MAGPVEQVTPGSELDPRGMPSRPLPQLHNSRSSGDATHWEETLPFTLDAHLPLSSQLSFSKGMPPRPLPIKLEQNMKLRSSRVVGCDKCNPLNPTEFGHQALSDSSETNLSTGRAAETLCSPTPGKTCEENVQAFLDLRAVLSGSILLDIVLTTYHPVPTARPVGPARAIPPSRFPQQLWRPSPGP